MGKTVVVVGVFSEGSSNNGIVRAFETLGWDVKRIPYREMANTVGVEATVWGIINVVEVFKPDLVLFCKFNGFPSSVVEECTKHSKTCVWYMDSFGYVRSGYPELISHCHAASFSIHWPGVADEFGKLNVKNCFGLIEGADESEFFPVPSVDKYRCDVSFIGTKNWRHKYIDALRASGVSVLTFGIGYDLYVSGVEFNAVCCSSKIVLNVATNTSVVEYDSDRLPRTLGTKSFTLVKHFPGIDKHYENHKHLVWFDSVDECVSLANKYVANSELRNKIANDGYEHFLSNHTTTHFVKNLLEILEGISK